MDCIVCGADGTQTERCPYAMARDSTTEDVTPAAAGQFVSSASAGAADDNPCFAWTRPMFSRFAARGREQLHRMHQATACQLLPAYLPLPIVPWESGP
jgi:hypothetical protein